MHFGQVRTEQRAEFMAYMARVMRSVIVDVVRAKYADKRGGQDLHVPLDTELEEMLPAPEAEVLHVHQLSYSYFIFY